MTPTQRAAALRLADAVMHPEAAALLRELAAEPVQKPVGWLHDETGDFEPSHKPWMDDDEEWVPLYAAPQQPMRCPEDGGACGAGGYCRPEPVQRRPLSDAFVYKVVRSVQPNLADTCKAWAEQFYECKYWLDAAHGITGEPT
jgi:hypothetical protein